MDTLQFVLTHFQPGRFNARNAWKRFSKNHGKTVRWPFWAASAAAAAILAAFLFFGWRNSWTEYHSYDLAQTFVLRDGSAITLSPGSELRLQPHRDGRSVQMKGQVLFSVAKNPGRPFSVRTEDAFVQVLGTVFVVQTQPEGTRADVLEGRVRFAASSEEEGLVLRKGESALIRDGQPQRSLQTPNPAAWAVGKFVYDETPLESVLEELSAFFGVRLQASQTDSLLSAEFSTESLEEIVEMIQLALNVEIMVFPL